MHRFDTDLASPYPLEETLLWLWDLGAGSTGGGGLLALEGIAHRRSCHGLAGGGPESETGAGEHGALDLTEAGREDANRQVGDGVECREGRVEAVVVEGV
jgi:hypothetical protein